MGDCFIVAANIATEEEGRILCHGAPVGQGELNYGRRYAHAWVEEPATDSVIDCSNGRNIQMARSTYYRLGQIEEVEVVRYTRQEALRQMVETRRFGPWHEYPADVL